MSWCENTKFCYICCSFSLALACCPFFWSVVFVFALCAAPVHTEKLKRAIKTQWVIILVHLWKCFATSTVWNWRVAFVHNTYIIFSPRFAATARDDVSEMNGYVMYCMEFAFKMCCMMMMMRWTFLINQSILHTSTMILCSAVSACMCKCIPFNWDIFGLINLRFLMIIFFLFGWPATVLMSQCHLSHSWSFAHSTTVSALPLYSRINTHMHSASHGSIHSRLGCSWR